MSKSVRTHVLLLTILLFPAFSVAAFASPTMAIRGIFFLLDFNSVLTSFNGSSINGLISGLYFFKNEVFSSNLILFVSA